jgi:RNA polymerase sigma-70 factor (ECF subfamily)
MLAHGKTASRAASVDEGTDQLVAAARRGDREALEELLRRVEPRVFRFGMKMCRDPEDARDVSQETLFAAARTLGGFRSESSLSTWLYAIARSYCIKARRRSVYAPEVVPLESAPAEARAAPDATPGPDRALADRERRAALAEAIAALAPEYRRVLLMRDVEGRPASEVAAATGLSVAAVKSRLHRARAAVKERILAGR